MSGGDLGKCIHGMNVQVAQQRVLRQACYAQGILHQLSCVVVYGTGHPQGDDCQLNFGLLIVLPNLLHQLTVLLPCPHDLVMRFSVSAVLDLNKCITVAAASPCTLAEQCDVWTVAFGQRSLE